MEFNEKLQELRRRKGLTQEELARGLFVSRTAISKWESGRGYPNIDSLKALAKFFSVTVDELLSSEEVLQLAEESNKEKEKHFRALVYGLLDLCALLFLFLPLFRDGSGDAVVQSVSLISLVGVQGYLKTIYIIVITLSALLGATTLVLQNLDTPIFVKSKSIISLALGMGLVLLFMISMQPYAAVFAFAVWAIKVLLLIKAD